MLMLTLSAFAQQKSAISGTLVSKSYDEKNAEVLEGVVGATIELMSLKDTLDKKYTVTAIRGAFQFKSVPAGEYRLTAESLGFKATSQNIKVTKNQPITLNDWIIEEDVLAIDAVSVKTQAVRTTINGDTVVYNAGAYKVLPDADADELLAKMPGIKVEGGSVEVQGEAVQKILIDGREFFGNDVATAIKTLPAQAVKSVEVFDKLSDEAEFSGIDDGNSYKAINLVTKIKTAYFGRVNAMYAFEPKENEMEKTQHYGNVDGNINMFREKSKTTLRFSANNMNGNSDSKMAWAGLNYINSWGKNDKVKLEGSYSFNTNNNKNKSWTERDYFLTEEELASNADDIYERYISNSINNSKGRNHKFDTRFEWKINDRQRLMLRANVSFNGSDTNGSSTSDYYPVSGIDQITLSNWNLGNNDGLNAGINGNYMLRIGEKAGRTLLVNFNLSYNDSNSNSENYSEKSVTENIQQRSNSTNYGYSMRGGVTYSEPIGKHAQATLEYNVNYNYRDAERLTHLYDFETGEYNPDISGEYSNINNTDYLTQRVGPGFRFSNNGSTISARLNYQHVTMNSDRTYPQPYILPSKSFNDLTYSVMARIKINMENRISVRMSSSTSNPSVNQLQDVVDISNVNHISAGNPHLKPSYSHRANINYTHSGIEKGTTFSVSFGGSKNQRQIVDSVVMNRPGWEVYSPDGELLTTLSSTGRYSKPVNMSGNWSYNGSISYGFPLNFIGCNLNVDAHGSYSQSPSILNGEINKSQNRSVGGAITLSSNFSDHVDFRFRYSPNYSNIENSMSNSGNNEYIRHNANGNIRVVFGFGLTLHANANYSKYQGLSESAKRLNNEDLIINLGMGMKVLKKMGEVQLVANDVLNRNSGFGRSWNALYMQNTMNSVIGRYFGVKFTYNIRSKHMRNQNTQQQRGQFQGGQDRNMGQGMGGTNGGQGMGGMRGGQGGFGGGGGRGF